MQTEKSPQSVPHNHVEDWEKFCIFGRSVYERHPTKIGRWRYTNPPPAGFPITNQMNLLLEEADTLAAIWFTDQLGEPVTRFNVRTMREEVTACKTYHKRYTVEQNRWGRPFAQPAAPKPAVTAPVTGAPQASVPLVEERLMSSLNVIQRHIAAIEEEQGDAEERAMAALTGHMQVRHADMQFVVKELAALTTTIVAAIKSRHEDMQAFITKENEGLKQSFDGGTKAIMAKLATSMPAAITDADRRTWNNLLAGLIALNNKYGLDPGSKNKVLG